MTLRILMFGRTGQLAREVLRRAGDGIAVTALDRDAADLGDPAGCADLVARAGADVVLNAAAFTAVDLAEAEEARAMRINAEAPGAMAQAAAARGLPFLHVSTDYVFDGTSPRPWREDDPVAPLNAYGRTKLAGERAVAAAGGPHVILRTAWVHAGHGRNFVASVLRAGATQARLRVVADQHGGPTPAGALAGAVIAIARAFAAGRGVGGVFHFCGAPQTSWYGFSREIFAQAPWIRQPVIEPIATADWPTPARRPLNSMLDCTKIAETYGLAQPDWRAGLGPIVAELSGRDR